MNFRKWLEVDQEWPDWWYEKTGRFSDQGKTEGEVVMDWLERHEVKTDENGKFIFYHGTPKGREFDTLRQGTQLETDPKSAAEFAAHDRGLDPKSDIEVIEVHIDPYEIYTGFWASLRGEYEVKLPTRT
jgi:hypothetical protein